MVSNDHRRPLSPGRVTGSPLGLGRSRGGREPIWAGPCLGPIFEPLTLGHPLGHSRDDAPRARTQHIAAAEVRVTARVLVPGGIAGGGVAGGQGHPLTGGPENAGGHIPPRGAVPYPHVSPNPRYPRGAGARFETRSRENVCSRLPPAARTRAGSPLGRLDRVTPRPVDQGRPSAGRLDRVTPRPVGQGHPWPADDQAGPGRPVVVPSRVVPRVWPDQFFGPWDEKPRRGPRRPRFESPRRR